MSIRYVLGTVVSVMCRVFKGHDDFDVYVLFMVTWKAVVSVKGSVLCKLTKIKIEYQLRGLPERASFKYVSAGSILTFIQASSCN
jgi:hypothetical protein